jgi:hypothetical protein
VPDREGDPLGLHAEGVRGDLQQHGAGAGPDVRGGDLHREAALRQRTGSRIPGSAASAELRTVAPMHAEPSSRWAIVSRSRPVMSISRSGRCTPSFIRSTRFVPPARNIVPGSAATASWAALASWARS